MCKLFLCSQLKPIYSNFYRINMRKLLRNLALLCAAISTAPSLMASVDGGISLPAFGTVCGETGQEFGFYVTVTNKCDEPLTSITYKVVKTDILASNSELNSVSDEDEPLYTIDLSANPLAAGKGYPLQFKAVAPDTDGNTNKMQIRIKTLNGQAYSKTANGKVTSVDFRPEVRSCVEDFTGTWCQWCPRGYVAMEQLNRDFPDKVLTIAYHNGDIMATGKFTDPISVPGYPYIISNRSVVSDAQLPSMGQQAMLYSNNYSPAGVTMQDSYWSDADHTNAVGVVEIEFGEDVAAGEYKIEFVLLEDGLKDPNNGEDAKTADYWKQVNKYESYPVPWNDPLWDLFSGKPSPVSGLTFNDVCLMNSLKSANGLVASIPATPARTKLYYTMTFKDVNNIVKVKTNLLMQPEKCRIGCILTKGGKYVNCHWMHVNNESAGIETVGADVAVDLNAPKEYYTISGMKVAADNLTPGLYIVRQGNHATKVVVR